MMAVYEIPNEVLGVFYVSFEFALSSRDLLQKSSREPLSMQLAYRARLNEIRSKRSGINRRTLLFVNHLTACLKGIWIQILKSSGSNSKSNFDKNIITSVQ